MSTRELFILMVICLLFAAGCESQPGLIEPTATMVEISAPTPTPNKIDSVLATLQGLQFDDFISESNRHLMIRDPDNLYFNEMAAMYGIDENDHFTDLYSQFF